MNISISIKNKKISIVLSILMTTAFMLSPLGSNSNAFAQGGVNTAAQGIAQGNNAAQNALCLSGASYWSSMQQH